MRPSSASLRLDTETFQEKSARLLLRSSSAWSFFQFCSPGDSRLVKGDIRPVAPDDSILLLICVLERFDNEIVPDVLKDLAYQFWPGDAVGDGTVGVDASVVGGVSVGEARESAVL